MANYDRDAHAKKNPAVIARMEAEGWTSARYTQRVMNKEAKEARKNAPYTLQLEDVVIRQADIKHGLEFIPTLSVNAIITDPLYDRRSLNLFSHLGQVASRVLVDSGVLLCMCPPTYLPEIMNRLGEYLRFWWQFIVIYPMQSSNLHFKRVSPNYKCVLLFTKQGHQYTGDLVSDVIYAPKPNKTRIHPMQQDEKVFDHLIESFTDPSHVVLDPFCGSGTTAICAVKARRLVVASDIDPEAVTMTRKRVYEALDWELTL